MLTCAPGAAQEARDAQLRRIMAYGDWEHMDEERFREMVSYPCPSYRFRPGDLGRLHECRFGILPSRLCTHHPISGS
jgi:hypothetical protein